jgi:tetratricopeptide (TPR) repeat protein
MKRTASVLFAIALALTSWACANSAKDGHDHAHTHVPRRVIPEGAGAPLFNDLGDFHRAVSTQSELAQRYFDQGLTLAYGFNHAEALRAFGEASRQDPNCAMCAWGEAYVVGPNINKPMDDADVPAAWAASRRALSLVEHASPVERALIGALARRYAAEPVADRAELDRAYAEAMVTVVAQFPEDVDVLTLFAEAWMDTMPWDYYENPDTPKPSTEAVVDALESVMLRDPDHIGALHLYIHAVEPSNSPARAEKAADTLGPLSPGAGHLVHMPSHIYLRVGRYHDASVANEQAATADESYITQCRAQGFYPAAYYPHNVHFLYASAAFEGRSAISIGAARKLAGNMTPEIVSEVPVSEEFAPMDLFALVRFGRWDEILAAAAPPEGWHYATGVWHFARGMAYAATGEGDDAEAELARLGTIASEPALSEMYFASGSTPAQLLTIGAKVLEARIAGNAARWTDAIAPLRAAVELQDALPYTEPPPWYFPTREALGHALIQAGQASEAEAVFEKQLKKTPRNGWSLLGLAQSQDAQGKTADATATKARLAEVWTRADVMPTAAVY